MFCKISNDFFLLDGKNSMLSQVVNTRTFGRLTPDLWWWRCWWGNIILGMCLWHKILHCGSGKWSYQCDTWWLHRINRIYRSFRSFQLRWTGAEGVQISKPLWGSKWSNTGYYSPPSKQISSTPQLRCKLQTTKHRRSHRYGIQYAKLQSHTCHWKDSSTATYRHEIRAISTNIHA